MFGAWAIGGCHGSIPVVLMKKLMASLSHPIGFLPASLWRAAPEGADDKASRHDAVAAPAPGGEPQQTPPTAEDDAQPPAELDERRQQSDPMIEQRHDRGASARHGRRAERRAAG